MAKRIRNQQIRAKLKHTGMLPVDGRLVTRIQLGGWLDSRPYLRIGDQDDNYLGSIEGAQLYRLAKAIVRRFEAKK